MFTTAICHPLAPPMLMSSHLAITTSSVSQSRMRVPSFGAVSMGCQLRCQGVGVILVALLRAFWPPCGTPLESDFSTQEAKAMADLLSRTTQGESENRKTIRLRRLDSPAT